MRFTFWAIGAPLLLFAFSLPFGLSRSTVGIAGLIGFIWVPWLWVGMPCTVIYWIVRLVRYAWRDGSAPAPAEPESGRIFGRLS